MKNNAGFTLIELLIVIAILAILAAVVFVSINPLKRFQDARDVTRSSDILSILDAIKIDQVDNRGSYLSSVSAMNAGQWYMIVNGSTMVSGCADNDINCDINVATTSNCVDLSGLITEGYLGEVPVSGSSGVVTWDDGSASGNEGTGYVLKRDTTGIIHIRACESENADDIKVSR